MGKSHVYRDLKLCTKDCLCLFVCPTGATNNETGQIDFSKCIGCGACMAACPSKAISMIPNILPKQQEKDEHVIGILFKIANNKIKENSILQKMLENDNNNKLIKALIHSNQVIIEDLFREAGYMIPQSKKSHELLESLKDSEVKNIVDKLLEKIPLNEN